MTHTEHTPTHTALVDLAETVLDSLKASRLTKQGNTILPDFRTMELNDKARFALALAQGLQL
jgi:hypothetical protein